MPIFKVRPFRPWPLMAGSSIYFFWAFSFSFLLHILQIYVYFIFYAPGVWGLIIPGL
jgi:hypothetical protein